MRRRLSIALSAGWLTVVAGKAGAADELLDPGKIAPPRKPADGGGLLAPGRAAPASTTTAVTGHGAPRKTSASRPAPNYARGMAESIVGSFDGFTRAMANLAARLKSLAEKEKKILAELQVLKDEYAAKMEEYRQGLFCSGCGKTKSEILARGEVFPHSGQHIVKPTPEQIASKERELQGPIDRAERELKDTREKKKIADDERHEAQQQVEQGLRLWRTAITFEINLLWADELDILDAYRAERKQASDQRDKLLAEDKQLKDEDVKLLTQRNPMQAEERRERITELRRALPKEIQMWDGILRKIDSERDGQARQLGANLKNASATAFRERDRLDACLKREGVSDIAPAALVAMAIQFPSSPLDFLGGRYRMGDFKPANRDNILPSVNKFILAFAAVPAGNCSVMNVGLNCTNPY